MLSVALVFGVASCTKDLPAGQGGNPFSNPGGGGTTTTDPDPGLPVGDVPASFSQKAVLEEFTGEWCGWCPEGAKIMDDAIAANPNTVIGIGVHDGDPMELPAFNAWIKGATSVSGFPNGSVQRANATGRGSWMGQITTALAGTPECGLAMVTSEEAGLIDVDVYIGYNAPVTGSTKLSLFITEDQVPQSSPGAQSNYSSSVVVDANWMHGHVLRGVISADAGDPVTLNSSDNYTLVQFNGVDISSMNILDMANVHVVAMVNVDDASTDSGLDILNAQQASLNETKEWD